MKTIWAGTWMATGEEVADPDMSEPVEEIEDYEEEEQHDVDEEDGAGRWRE